MFDKKYLDIFVTGENNMAKEMFHNFVEKEIMPFRQQVGDDKEHVIVRKILPGRTESVYYNGKRKYF